MTYQKNPWLPALYFGNGLKLPVLYFTLILSFKSSGALYPSRWFSSFNHLDRTIFFCKNNYSGVKHDKSSNGKRSRRCTDYRIMVSETKSLYLRSYCTYLSNWPTFNLGCELLFLKFCKLFQ